MPRAKLNVKTLKERAKNLGVQGASTMKKKALIGSLQDRGQKFTIGDFVGKKKVGKFADVLDLPLPNVSLGAAGANALKNTIEQIRPERGQGLTEFRNLKAVVDSVSNVYVPPTVEKRGRPRKPRDPNQATKPKDSQPRKRQTKPKDAQNQPGNRGRPKGSNIPKFELQRTAINDGVLLYSAKGKAKTGPEEYMELVEPRVYELSRKNKKITFTLRILMRKYSSLENKVISDTFTFRSRTQPIIDEEDIIDIYRDAIQEIKEGIETFNNSGSGWTISKIEGLDVQLVDYTPLSGESYMELPKFIADKKAVINIKNTDDKCFMWAVTRALNMESGHNERVTIKLKEAVENYDWTDLPFPTSIRDISIFEKKNKGIAINVLSCDYNDSRNGVVYPLRVSKVKDGEDVNLLLISNLDKEKSNSHYCVINSLNRLLDSQVSNNKEKKYFCLRCLLNFPSEDKLKDHKEYCDKNGVVRITLPDDGAKLRFSHANRSQRLPFVIYADFESTIEPMDTCQPNPKESYTMKIQKHTPNSFAYYVKCSFDDSKSEMVSFVAENKETDVASEFINSINNKVKEIYSKNSFPKTPKYVSKAIIEAEEYCASCGSSKFMDDNDPKLEKVGMYCHYTGKYLGAKHKKCKPNIQKIYPIYFHNLSGYDAHLFITKFKDCKVSCIPSNEEKYISFSTSLTLDTYTPKKGGKPVNINGEIRYLDSYRFMPSSLDSLAKNLEKSQCYNLAKYYKKEKLDLMLIKGVYPYEYMDNLDKMNDTQLPPIKAFHSKLSGETKSLAEYNHAQLVWNKFNCKTFRDYHEIYNISDVLLLADVFENFRDVCMKNYGLDPGHYYTSPGLSWDACLKLTNINLDLLTDYEMVLMVKNGIRGGISMISNRLGIANNKYMENYDPNKESKYIQYLDANNLYGWAMSNPLPTSKFEWMSEQDIKYWEDIPCILEVDIEYPQELHDLHNDYPMAPENIKTDGSNVNKLTPNLQNKYKYVIHHVALKQCIELGLKITQVHRGIKFIESPWLKEYITLNTNLRTKATNNFEKDFFKLMNNSVFGKTMENIEKRVDIKMVTDHKKLINYTSQPNYDRCTIFSEDFIAVHMKRTRLHYDKPIYLGMSILDLSKTLMYDFHYNYMKKKYGTNAKLLFTDTDSLAYEIKTDDVYLDFKDDIQARFDTSDFKEDHPAIKLGFKNGINKKVIGMFKDEAGGRQIDEFVGLRAKLYSYTIGEYNSKKCKGVKRAVVENTITHEDYKKCLLEGKNAIRAMNVLRSHRHEMYGEEINKLALSSNDTKRYILEDKISTLAWGHYKIPASEITTPNEPEK